MARMIPRLLIVLLAATLTLLVVEGVLSLGFNRSLRKNALGSIVTGFVPQNNDGLDPASRLPPAAGFLRYHPNPRIGIEVPAGGTVRVIDCDARIESDGMRARVGPPEESGALRIVILGDSVAFGIRLRDEETIASHLEAILDSVRDPSGRDVVCETLASPGWNSRNSTAAMFDRLATERPDIVVLLPIDNDLSDTLGIGEGGGATPAPDVLSPQPLLRAGYETVFARVVQLANEFRAGARFAPLDSADLGIIALNIDVTVSSRLRYDAECAAILKLDRALRVRNATLYLQYYLARATEEAFTTLMRQRIRRVTEPSARIPEIEGFGSADASFTLRADMHPSAVGARALAILIARRLLADGRITLREGAELEALDAEIESFVAPIPSDDELDERAAALRQDLASRCVTRLEPGIGRGCLQVIGGLNPDASIGPDFVGVLRRGADRVRIVVAPLDPAPPADVDLKVELDGTPIGSILVAAGSSAPIERTFDLPATDSVFEVRLTSSEWWTRFGANKRLIAACRLVEIASE